MKIYTDIEFGWDGKQYQTVNSTEFEYEGILSLCCGASSQQTDTYNTQQQLTQTLINQMGQVFGSSSSVFNSLVAGATPIYNAGPDQMGWSPEQKAAMDSAAINTTAASYQSARQSIGEQVAAQGGGNINLPSGAQIAPQLALSEKAAQQQASELNQNTLADATQGRENWLDSAKILQGAPSVFNTSTGAANSAVGSGSAQSTTANEISQANNSWVNALIGAGGAILGGAATHGFSGGGSTPSQLTDASYSFG
jgi:hypothetical protein